MPTELLGVGHPIPITQNTVYALPSYRVRLYCDAAGATFQQSNTLAFTASTAVTLVDGSAEVSAGFLRCTSAAPGLITLKRE